MTPPTTLLTVLVGVLILLPRMTQAQAVAPGFVCGVTDSLFTVGESGDIDDGPDVRALIVFVRFNDDANANDGRGWPLYANPEQLPPFAEHILAPDAASITASDSSLSRFYYDQSRLSPSDPAQLRLFGDIQPRDGSGDPIVYVTDHDNARYHWNWPGGGGYGYLSKEILDKLFPNDPADPAPLDPADYDLNEDGVLDHLFLVIRSEHFKVSSPPKLVTPSAVIWTAASS